jgi:predicted SprT family Zn-dependent metalloprotease
MSPRILELDRRRAFAIVARVLGMAGWPETVEVRWNRRLRRAGRAVIDGTGSTFERAVIELSPAYFENYPEDLYGILVHEAVHVGLAIQGRPFGHGPEFKQACVAGGGLLHGRALPGLVYRYRCPVCASVLERRRRLARDRWCASCVEAAAARDGDPEAVYAPDRALVLVETSFAGRERGNGDAGG